MNEMYVGEREPVSVSKQFYVPVYTLSITIVIM